MDFWFYEKHIPGMGICLKIKKILYFKKSKYQEIAILETEDFGRMLVIDGMVMLTERDEFIYHEMLVHVPLFVHPNPEKILVIGGGDGGTVREIIKHRNINRVTMVEIDRDVIEASKKFLPSLSSQLNNRHLKLIIGDGIKYVKDKKGKFDIVILDSSDPVGPAKGLFSKDFFRNVHSSLKADGIMVAQTETPFMDREIIRQTYKILKKLFPLVKMYFAPIPTYPSGMWSFAFASKEYDPLINFNIEKVLNKKFLAKYYNEDVHRGAFMLPEFMKGLLR